MALSAVGFIAVFGIIVSIGDNVGVQVARFGPEQVGTSTSFVSVQFDEVMDRSSVEERFSIEPEIEGEFSWNGSRLIFRPAIRLTPETNYSVTVGEGAQSEAGRELLEEFNFQFRVRGARVAYLKTEEDGIKKNIWVADPSGNESPQRLTNSPFGVVEYDISLDGSKIVFLEGDSSEDSTATPQLKMLDVRSGEVTQITFFDFSLLSEPQWNFDGTQIAYTRINTGARVPGVDPSQVGLGLPQVWLTDLTQEPPSHTRLLGANEGMSHSPHWSPTENVIVMGSDVLTRTSVQQLTVLDLDEDRRFQVESDLNAVVSFQANGTSFLSLDRTGTNLRSPTTLREIDIASGQVDVRKSSEDATPVRDVEIEWQPGTRKVATLRRDVDGAQGNSASLYLVDFESGESTLVLEATQHIIHGMKWSPSGSQLAVDWQRRSDTEGADSAREVVIYSLGTGEFVPIDQEASNLQWIP